MFRLIIKLSCRLSWMLSLLLAANFALAQTEFSAEIVDTANGAAAVRAKIYFAKDKLRFEPTQNNARGGGALIMNLATQISTALMDQQHMYMEIPAQMASQRIAYNFFRTGDAENACADWVQQTRNKGGTCHKVGSDTVNGRSAVKYDAKNAAGDATSIWIDPKLRFPVKWLGSNNSSGELRNIQEGPQAASLFEIPAGYTKMDMGGMMHNPK